MWEFEQMRDTPEKQMEKTRQRCYELKTRRNEEDKLKTQAIITRKFQFVNLDFFIFLNVIFNVIFLKND